MLAKVEENVDQRVPDLAGRTERVGVVAVDPDGAAALGGAIDGSGSAHGQTVHTVAQGCCGVGLHDEVDMVGLHGELGHAKRATTRSGE